MIIKEWHSDIEITEEIVKSYLQEQFSALFAVKNIQYIGEGWDNKVFLINKKVVFRFPHRKAAIEFMDQENILLNNLPVFPGIEIPKLKYIGRSTAEYPYPCQGYEIIEGYSAYKANLSDQDRSINITTLANFLKQLHSIDVNMLYTIGITSQGEGSRANSKKTIKVLKERINKIRSFNIVKINTALLKDEIDKARKVRLRNESCFVHGDLDCRHLIFNGTKLKGIIDWGDMDITSRSVDLAVVWGFFPRECHNKFLEIYGVVDSDMWVYARFLALYHAFSLLLYGQDIKDSKLIIEAITSIKRINPNLIHTVD